MNDVRVYANAETVAQAVADYLFQKITDCVNEKGVCHVVLPGGSTPARCLQLLSEKSLPWKNIHWYPGDERCYPVGHSKRNDTMIRDKLFSQQSPPSQTGASENFHPIPAELGPEQGAKDYAALLDTTDAMDIVVLGMGEDGHTASLFPGNVALNDLRSAVPVYDAPKPPSERVSISLNTLKKAGECIVIATGEGKREAMKKIKAGRLLPVAMVEPELWFLDESALPA